MNWASTNRSSVGGVERWAFTSPVDDGAGEISAEAVEALALELRVVELRVNEPNAQLKANRLDVSRGPAGRSHQLSRVGWAFSPGSDRLLAPLGRVGREVKERGGFVE